MRKNENVLNVLAEKANIVHNASMAVYAVTQDWQTIREYMCNRLNYDNLTEVQKKKLERYNFIYSNLLSDKYSKVEVIKLLERFYSISQKQAYEDYNCVVEIYPSVSRINKNYELMHELEVAKDLRRKAAAVQDWKSAAAFQKNIIAITALLPDEEDNSADLFEGHNYELTFNPELLGGPKIDDNELADLLKTINAKRSVKINLDNFEIIQEEKK